jgi:hypothetical protein
MPSISDVYNQLVTANAALQQLHVDLVDISTQTKAVNTSIGEVNATLTTNFASVLSALSTLVQLNQYECSALFHISDQDNTIICNLEKISKQTCELVSFAALQTRSQNEIERATRHLLEVAKIAEPAAALEVLRTEEMERRMAECCPHKEPPPACTYVACAEPRSELGPPPGQPKPIP